MKIDSLTALLAARIYHLCDWVGRTGIPQIAGLVPKVRIIQSRHDVSQYISVT